MTNRIRTAAETRRWLLLDNGWEPDELDALFADIGTEDRLEDQWTWAIGAWCRRNP